MDWNVCGIFKVDFLLQHCPRTLQRSQVRRFGQPGHFKMFPDGERIFQTSFKMFPGAQCKFRMAFKRFPDGERIFRTTFKTFPDAQTNAGRRLQAFPDAIPTVFNIFHKLYGFYSRKRPPSPLGGVKCSVSFGIITHATHARRNFLPLRPVRAGCR
jgi:hypothetical protein